MGNSHSTTDEKSDMVSKNGKKLIKNVSNDLSKDPADLVRMSRSPSGADIYDKTNSNFVPIEKLSKILLAKSQEQHDVHGITGDIFVKYVFPRYPDLGHRLFKLLHTHSKATTKYLGTTAFRQQCERFLSILDDQIILENCIKMYSADPEITDIVKPENFRNLLRTCFDLTMALNPDEKRCCPMIDRTLNSIISSCFFSKESLSIGFICRWLEQNCPRLVPPIYKFCQFTLTSAYRGIESNDTQNMGLELATPILEKSNPFGQQGNGSTSNSDDNIAKKSEQRYTNTGVEPPLLPTSEAWLMASALDPLYSKPQQIQSPITSPSSSVNLASQIFMAKFLSYVPSHWTLLYDSMQNGVGSNRFLHHVLGYKGPTIILLRGNDDHIYAIASPSEWRETHMFTGGDHCAVIQLLPKFSLIEHGQKMLYLNTIHRGYPKGLRAGSDPRKPLIAVDEQFEKFEYRGVPYQLISIEVWGCGDKQSRDIQMDIKKWQVKEAERQRTVKLSAADWIDHPDRYLLELGGRPNYNNSAN